MTNLTRCLRAAEAMRADPMVVRKAGYPTRPEFDAALDELADYLKTDGERYHRAYARALDSPDGQLLYGAREWAAAPEPVWKRREPPVLTKAEQAIADAVTAYAKDHPQWSREKALLQVLDARPELYTAYEREKSESV